MTKLNVFKRYEMKYIITKEQKKRLLNMLGNYIEVDEFGKYTINSIYFDTPDFRMIRNSIEKPAYKEKLRVRSYGISKPDTIVYMELKKKMDSIVYKRRIGVKEKEAMDYLCRKNDTLKNTQIKKEIDYVEKYYDKLEPKVFLSYEREAYYAKDNKEFRLTFDDNIMWRDYDLSLCKGSYGTKLLKNNEVLIEVKTETALPMWLTSFLSQEHIYKTSFSKYGSAYIEIIQNKNNGGKKYA